MAGLLRCPKGHKLCHAIEKVPLEPKRCDVKDCRKGFLQDTHSLRCPRCKPPHDYDLCQECSDKFERADDDTPASRIRKQVDRFDATPAPAARRAARASPSPRARFAEPADEEAADDGDVGMDEEEPDDDWARLRPRTRSLDANLIRRHRVCCVSRSRRGGAGQPLGRWHPLTKRARAYRVRALVCAIRRLVHKRQTSHLRSTQTAGPRRPRQ